MEKTGSGFYIVDAFSLRQTSRKPFHLEKRFLKSNGPSTSTLEEAEIKREALLEERRQRLNRKFLEAQQVVQQAKARKESQRLDFMRSLQLAEHKRNSHIEQRRAASKELVERAKVIARQNSQRFEAEQARLRRALEDRLEQSHARRLHMLTQPKSRILVTGTSGASADCRRKKMKRTTSSAKAVSTGATTMTVTIRPGDLTQQPVVVITDKKKPEPSWKHLCVAFHKLGLPKSSHPEGGIPFNELVGLLRNKRVIQVTAKVLKVLFSVSDKESRKRSRVLLSAYMMTICPREVFQDIHDSEEQLLLAQAKQLLRRFEQFLETKDEPAPRLAFEECWNGYYALFESWKAKDMRQLVANMSAYCVELIRLKQTLGQQDDEVKQQLDEQIQQVKERIGNIGGPSAIQQLEETERVMFLAQAADATQQQHQGSTSVPPSPTPRPERIHTAATETGEAIAAEELKRMLSGYTSAGGITNHQLAHEIIIDPDFKLQKQTSNLEEHVRKIATQAFFDRVAEDIREGHPEQSLPALMDDVRQRLLNLVPQGSGFYNQVNEGLDIALITQEATQKTFDLDRALQFVVHIISQLCAPVRDEAVRKIGDIEDPVQRLRAVLEMLDEMMLDLSNYRLRSLRPYLIPIAVEYERGKFAESLAKGAVGLARTRSWLKQAVRRLNEVAAERNPESVPTPQRKVRADSVFEEAFISLLTSSEIISPTACPETLLLDVDRMHMYQNEAQSITIVAALVMLAKNFGHTGDLSVLTNKLSVMLEDGQTTIDNLALEIERTVRVSPERKPMIRAMVDKTISHSDTVYSLLMRRVGSVIRSQLQSGTSVTREVLVSYGLDHVRKPLEMLSTRVMILGRHHRKVYASWYDEIINDEINALA